jgi:hypothetical protein
LGKDERQGADVVLVSMSDQNAPDVVGAFDQIGDVGDDEVYPEHTLFGKLDPAIDDDNIVAVLQGHHVFADFPETSQGNDA